MTGLEWLTLLIMKITQMPRIGVAAGLCALTTAVLPLAGTTITSQAAAADIELPVLLETSLPQGVDAKSVLLFAVPPSSDSEQVGDVRAYTPIENRLVVEADGFSIQVDPLSIPSAVRRPDGLVDLNLFVTDAQGQGWNTFMTARAAAIPLTTSARTQTTSTAYRHLWVSPLDSEDDVTTKRAPSGYPVLRARTQSGVTSRSAVDPYDYDDEVVDVNPYEFVDVEIPRQTRDANDCFKETYTGDTNRQATIGTSYPVGATVSKMTHTNSTSNSSTLGVAVGPENSSGAAQWKQGGTKSVGGSWTGGWTYSGDKRSYRIYTNYHKYVLGAASGCNGQIHYRRPHIETGGAGVNTSGLTRPDWNTYCAPQPKSFTFTRSDSQGSAYSYGAGVKFASAIGIDLSLKKSYNTHNTLQYQFSGSVAHKLCGNNDYPSQASKMIDRFQ